ncbi:MAG TPA: ABC transporter permease subunit [Actinomycetota bacterium]|nr:ABC transporter permease subunit [Actinomycetota bacterium]
MNLLVVARWTVLEARRRRLLLAGVVLSIAFVVVFALAFSLLYHSQERNLLGAQAGDSGPVSPREQLLVLSTILVVLGLYGVQFLAALLGLFLGVASVSPEVDSGALHAVLARPISRLDYLLGRFLALAGMLTVYVVVMSGSLLLTARVVAGYEAGDATRAVGLMILEVLVLLAVSVLGSSVLPTLTNGVIMLALFGLAWLGGVVGFIGSIPPGNELLANLGTAVGLLLPADAVWRGASYHVLPSGLLIASSVAGGADLELPFGSTTPIAPALLAWAVAYPTLCLGLAVACFRRRDL